MTFDRLLAGAVLFLLSPMLLLVALLIVLDSPGLPFFLQERVGKDGKPFYISKFRTMTQARRPGGMQLTAAGDARITRVGQWLRQYKIDELPQLINVLRGEMNLVGPRPEVPKYVRYYSETERRALSVPPGITDLATLYYRNESEELAEQEDPEAYYIESILPRKLALNLAYLDRRFAVTDAAVLAVTALVSVLPGRLSDMVHSYIEEVYVNTPVSTSSPEKGESQI